MEWEAAIAYGVIGLMGKIVFDWLKGRTNGKVNETSISLLREIRDVLIRREVIFQRLEDNQKTIMGSQERIEQNCRAHLYGGREG